MAFISSSERSLQKLQEQRRKIFGQQASLTANGKEDSEIYRSLTAELKEVEANIASFELLINNPAFPRMRDKEEQEERNKTAAAVVEQITPVVKQAAAPAVVVKRGAELDGEFNAEMRRTISAAFRGYIRNDERRDILQSGAGIGLVPQQFDADYVQALKASSPLGSLCPSIKDSQVAKLISIDDTATGSNQVLLTEATNLPADSTPAFASFVPQWTSSGVSNVLISWQAIADLHWDYSQLLTAITKGRIARWLDSVILNGKDTAGNALPTGNVVPLLPAVTINTVASGTLAAGPAFGDFIKLRQSLVNSGESAYDDNAAFIVSPKVYGFILGLMDSTGRPLYRFENGVLYLLDKPVWRTQAFATYGASKVQVLYGDYSKAFIYQAANMVRSNIPNPEAQITQWTVETRFAGSITPFAASAVVSLTSAAS